MNIDRVRVEMVLNGRLLATSGIERFGVLSAVISWVRRNPSNVTAEMRAKDEFDELHFLREVCELEFGGLDSVADRNVFWGKKPFGLAMKSLFGFFHKANTTAHGQAPNISLNPDASPAALARRPLGAG